MAVAGATGLQLRPNVEGAFARAFSASPQPLLVWRSSRQLFGVTKPGDWTSHYYPADTIHVTIRNLDDAAREECNQPSLFSKIRDLAEGGGSFVLKGKGLGVSPNSVFLQMYPEDKGLANLRHQLSTATSDRDRRRPKGSGIVGGLARRYLFEKMAFATLIRFSGPVTPAFLAEVARHRETDFGTFSINAVEIVRTDKFLSNAGTEIIARIVVGGDLCESPLGST